MKSSNKSVKEQRADDRNRAGSKSLRSELEQLVSNGFIKLDNPPVARILFKRLRQAVKKCAPFNKNQQQLQYLLDASGCQIICVPLLVRGVVNGIVNAEERELREHRKKMELISKAMKIGQRILTGGTCLCIISRNGTRYECKDCKRKRELFGGG